MTISTAADPGLGSASDGAAATAPGAARPTNPVGILSELFAATLPIETLQAAVRLARSVTGCDESGIVLTGARGDHVPTTASGAEAARADALQLEHHEGPALAAMACRQPVVSAELRSDSRWRFWGPTSADLGFRSVLSLPLVDGDPFGALTLYSRRPSFFPPEVDGLAQAFGQQASIAITLAVEREQLLRARDSRGTIGQAQGILMQRYGISAEQAFAALRRYSSHHNVKLRLVAEQVIRDRELPGTAQSRTGMGIGA